MSRIIYGVNPVRELVREKGQEIERVIVASGRIEGRLRDVVMSTKTRGIVLERLSRREMDKIAGTDKHQGVIAFGAGFRYADLEDILASCRCSEGNALILVLDGIQDPRNLGSLIRSAHAAGANGIIIPKDRATAVTATVVKASAGATELTPVARVTNIPAVINRLKEEKIWVMAIEADSPRNIYDTALDMDIAIVVGSEGKGVRRLVRERCDLCLSIPMAGSLSSLNASVAGAVALFEAVRQRRLRRLSHLS